MEHVGQYYEKGACKGYVSSGGGTGERIIDEGLAEWSLMNKVTEKSQDGSYRLVGRGAYSIIEDIENSDVHEPRIPGTSQAGAFLRRGPQCLETSRGTPEVLFRLETLNKLLG